MWCRHCQQDVPAVAKAADSGVQCARCQRPLDRHASRRVDSSGEPIDEAAESVVFEPWKLADIMRPDDEKRLQEIGRSLRSTRAHATARKPANRALRIDQPQLPGETPLPGQAAATSQPAPARREPVEPRPPVSREGNRPNQFTAWAFALLGALVLGIGLGLLGWCVFGQRPELWDLGVAATLTGQGLLIVGLVLLLANLWTGTRDSSNRLIALQYEIRRLQRTADSLAGMRSSTPSAFYADLARGSSPQVMLANLKGQVEELTSRLSAT
ncbi:MAG: hypothetical protein AAF589_02970 [Planctomycetota bacterium]